MVFDLQDLPVSLVVNNLNGTNSVDWTVIMAAAVLTGCPTVLVHITLGRYVIRGMFADSMKG